ncbi:hypothetical protein ACFV5G_12490 [Streptomyces sp. NPDC059766]
MKERNHRDHPRAEEPADPNTPVDNAVIALHHQLTDLEERTHE